MARKYESPSAFKQALAEDAAEGGALCLSPCIATSSSTEAISSSREAGSRSGSDSSDEAL